jgi:predicted small integral membrane protein
MSYQSKLTTDSVRCRNNFYFVHRVIENLITSIDRLFPDVTITANRPFSPNPIIQVSNLQQLQKHSLSIIFRHV